MSAGPEPIYWPEKEEDFDHVTPPLAPGRIYQLRHRVGQYVVTRLILEPPQPVWAERPHRGAGW